MAACSEASQLAGKIKSKDSARAFFERNFTPNAVVTPRAAGMLTGYYEPVLEGSRTPKGLIRPPSTSARPTS